MMNKVMKEREKTLNVKWKDEGNGYYSLIGFNKNPFSSGELAYIAIPEKHPDINKNYDDFHDLEVNGGLTFGNGNVYGWDYCHAFNSGTSKEDIKEAIKFFKSRENKK